MPVTWDEAKRVRNLRKHKLDDDTRILSMRKATPAEARRYFDEITD